MEEPRKFEKKRHKLYDRIKIPLRTMDLIIYTIVALLVIAVFMGIILGGAI